MECVDGPYLPSFIQATERRVRADQGTFRTIAEQADTLGFENTDVFIDYLVGDGTNVVLDAGSGLDGLAFDAQLRNLPVTIYSLNAARVHIIGDQQVPNENFLEWRKRMIGHEKRKLIREVDENERDSMLERVDQNALVGFGHSIPLPDNSVDRIIDNYAITHYSRNPKVDPEVYMLYLLEALRVLKEGGTIRIEASLLEGSRTYINRVAFFQSLADLGYLSYALIKKNGTTIGAEITKLKNPEFRSSKP